ncbi:hypothetical protein QEH56_05050 [Pelagicoccus enzymogenes]|uniref:pyroglutamyl-peptidase I family protein n=1 Tax=Pelagicoccus enzymogenes TaxID=2773457 RepID=UPI00280E848A|nr:hypothetical protein [Pelagicoccus enzymogenes]MDQ8197503.1 hypothetical protein [Pelagicoccus enzymogenes]
MNLLLAGLETIDASSQSLACQCVTRCASLEFEGHHVKSVELPARWDDCFHPLESVISQPWDAILILSEKVSDSIAIERIAINETDVSQKDAVGRRPRGKTIEASGDPGYWTTLPYRELASKLTAAKFTAIPSHSAGMALANYACYRMMHALVQQKRHVCAGLLQLPFSGSVFSEEEAKRFMAVLLQSLDPQSVSQDKLGFDLPRAADRLGANRSIR